jgi:mono/diheme cytochrome c family protein
MRLSFLSFMVIAAVFAVSQVHAQETRDDVRLGRALVHRVCAECHAVETTALNSPNPLAPRFDAVAATPGMTSMALNAFLHTSHRAMPNIILTSRQTDRVIAYILSLKK